MWSSSYSSFTIMCRKSQTHLILVLCMCVIFVSHLLPCVNVELVRSDFIYDVDDVAARLFAIFVD